MGKQKNLAIEEAEIANESPKKGPVLPLPSVPTQRVITDGFLIQEPLLKATLTYLASRPYSETANLIGSLSSLPKMESVTVTERPA